MKKLLVLMLAVLMLLTSCGGGTVVDPSETDPIVSTPKEDFSIAVKEDAFVCDADGDGDQSENNFGGEKFLDLKGKGYKRYTYLKFDLSSLAGDKDFTSIELDLTVYDRQADVKSDAIMILYGCDTNWSENTITYKAQPFKYSEITKVSDLKTSEIKDEAMVTKSFSVTDYIRLCLAEGKTEAAFYLEENTPNENGIRINIYSKENGQYAPALKVSYSKVDNTKYNGQLAEELPEVSENGLDAIFGISRDGDSLTIPVKEDTFIDGSQPNTVLGNETAMEIKDVPNSVYHRVSFVKFDIMDLYSSEYNSVYLKLTAHDGEDYSESPIKLYGCDPYSWDEKTLTYKNNKSIKEDLVATANLKQPGTVSFNVTSYVEEMIKLGEKQISFIIENDGKAAAPKRYMLDTREMSGGTPAYLEVNDDLNFTTHLVYEGENPWQVAMDNVNTWLERWEEIKKGGDKDAERITWNYANEFTETVGAATVRQTNGADTVYSNQPTRLVSTLKNYKYNNAETSLYDEYGGFMGGEKYEATGYFYTTKIGDRWWTIDPLGYPFYRVACVQITPGVSSAQKRAIVSEFTTNSKWAAWATDLFKDYGFNSTGGWSDIKTLSRIEEPLVQTKILGVLTNYISKTGVNTTSGGSVTMVGSIMPVFDPAFVSFADEWTKKEVKGYEDKAYIYGWMSDNELPDDDYMLDNTLKADPSDSRFAYSYATAWTFMYLKTGNPGVSVHDVTPELRREYKAMVYDKYFEVVTAAHEKHVPNHQYLGCRFLPENYKQEMVIRVAGYWCDVISINWYESWTPRTDFIYNWQYWAGKPFIITEWYAKGMDIWEIDNRITNQSGSGWTVKTQEDRGMFYQNFALGLMECKACVGFDWFKYWDNDPDDLSADISNRDSNKGMFNTAHEEYTDLTKYMIELNKNKYSLIEFFDAR